mgnify:CR=1 FL=1
MRDYYNHISNDADVTGEDNMGHYSDVALAIKPEAWKALHTAGQHCIDQLGFELVADTEQGRLYRIGDTKWYWQHYWDIQELYKRLGSLDPQDFLLLVAFKSWPASDEADLGKWFTNPWDVFKDVSVELTWRAS